MKPSFLRVGVITIAFFLLTESAWADTLKVNGFEMYYEIAGQGQPLLLLHGFAQVGEEWDPIRGELEKSFRLIIPDLRGHGSSTNPGGEFTNRQVALDLFALLDHLGVGRIQAIGFSIGGEILLHMATQQPDRLDAMVLIGATPYYTEQSREVMMSGDSDDVPAEVMDELREIHRYGDEQILALLRHDQVSAENYDDQNFTAPYLSTITARTLIMQGDRDRYNPVRIALEMYEAIPKSYLWIVPNMDHLAMWGPTRDHFVCTATAFFRDQWQSRPARLCE